MSPEVRNHALPHQSQDEAALRQLGIHQQGAPSNKASLNGSMMLPQLDAHDRAVQYDLVQRSDGHVVPQLGVNMPQQLVPYQPQAPPTGTMKSHGTVNPNKQKDEAPLQERTCIYINNLPPHCTPNQILGSIRGIGKVWSLQIQPPSQKHKNRMAELTFWDRPATDRFLLLSRTGNFKVGTLTSRVEMTQLRGKVYSTTTASRVVGLRGPPEIINEEFLRGFFQRCNIKYEIDCIKILFQDTTATHLEFHFASFHRQAEEVFQYIQKVQRIAHASGIRPARDDEWLLWRRVSVYWGVDPCS